jgi:hypothetical protein
MTRIASCIPIGRRTTSLVCALMMMSSAPPTLASSMGPRTEIPIYRRVLSNGDVRFVVPIQIGEGPATEAMLDTGSTGLRVLSRAVSSTQYMATEFVRAYGYGSGVVYRGPLAYAHVSVGPVHLPDPISIQIIQSVSCRKTKPQCPASRVSEAAYGIGGEGLSGEGFNAILGVSLRSSSAPAAANNPLLAYGSDRWIVILPTSQNPGSGKLIVNPTAQETAGFHVVSSGQTDNAGLSPTPGVYVANCPEQPVEQQGSCPRMLLDSGWALGVSPFYLYAVLYNQSDRTISVQRRDSMTLSSPVSD